MLDTGGITDGHPRIRVVRCLGHHRSSYERQRGKQVSLCSPRYTDISVNRAIRPDGAGPLASTKGGPTTAILGRFGVAPNHSSRSSSRLLSNARVELRTAIAAAEVPARNGTTCPRSAFCP